MRTFWLTNVCNKSSNRKLLRTLFDLLYSLKLPTLPIRKKCTNTYKSMVLESYQSTNVFPLLQNSLYVHGITIVFCM